MRTPRKPVAKKQSEDSLQGEIVSAMRHIAPKLLFFHVPNGGNRNQREGSKFKRMGVMPGVSDLICILPGDVVFIEIKTANGVQSKSQLAFESWVRSLGYEYHVIRSVEECIPLAIKMQTKILRNERWRQE